MAFHQNNFSTWIIHKFRLLSSLRLNSAINFQKLNLKNPFFPATSYLLHWKSGKKIANYFILICTKNVNFLHLKWSPSPCLAENEFLLLCAKQKISPFIWPKNWFFEKTCHVVNLTWMFWSNHSDNCNLSVFFSFLFPL